MRNYLRLSAILLLFPLAANASGMPWDTTICDIANNLRTTVAAAVAVVAIVLAGLSYAHSDVEWFRFLMGVIIGVGIAAGAVYLVGLAGLRFGC